MGELEDKLGSILGDPQAMNQIMNMASAFMDSSQNSSQAQKNENLGEFSGIDPESLSRIIRIASEFNRNEDESASLLYAIKPYLNRRRQSKFKDALTVMRLAKILPRIKKEGLF